MQEGSETPASAEHTVINTEEAVAPKAASLDGSSKPEAVSASKGNDAVESSSDNSKPDSSGAPENFETPSNADSIVEADTIDSTDSASSSVNAGSVENPDGANDTDTTGEFDNPVNIGDADQVDAINNPDNVNNADNTIDANSDNVADNAGSIDITDSAINAGSADNVAATHVGQADSIDNVDAINAGQTDSADQSGNTSNLDSDSADASITGQAADADQTADTDIESGEGSENKTDDEPEEEHLPTRQELIQKQNAQIRRENNRKYAEEHASRAARRWQEESQEEPFAIVRGTCYYSALESETTVRGNFSKKRYKDDELPQNEPVSYEDSEWYQGFENAYDPWGDYVEPDEKEKKKGVSYKAWFIILLLIIFWPAGLILMWVRKKFPLAVRIIITLIIAGGLAFEGYFLYNYGPAMYEEYMYGDNSNITYETPSSDSDSSDSDTTQSAAATENQQKALDKANEYIDTLALSHDGLIKQLEYDGYSTDVATYAADNCDANWNKEAKEMAEQYMESTTYTYKAMVQQLQAEGFTKDQAKFGAKAVGLE